MLNAVKEASGWETRPSPSPKAATDGLDAGHRPGLQRDAAVGRLLGLRCQGVGRPEDRTLSNVTNLNTVVDPGVVVNPRQLTRMAEGGATMGVSEALHEQVTLQQGRDHATTTG